MTVPTPICPIPTCLHPSRVIRIIPEHPMLLPNPLAPSRANSCLSNALPNTPTPSHLVDAFPTRCSFDLSSSSHQVDSRHPHPFPTQCLLTFTLLRQVYSQRFIGLATAVGRSPIAYLPHLMRLSPSFLALYISVRSLSHHSLPFICFLRLILSSPSPSTLVSSIFILSLRRPYFSYSIHSLRPIPDRSDQPDPYHTRTCINTLVTSCCSLSLRINFDTPHPSSAPPVNHGLIVIARLTPSSMCVTSPTTQQSPLDKARLKAMDARRHPMPCPIPELTSPSSGGHFWPFPIRLALLPIGIAQHISDSLYAV